MLGVVGHELAASESQSVDRSASSIVRTLLVCATARLATLRYEEQNGFRVRAGGGKYGKRFETPLKQELPPFRGTVKSLENGKSNASAVQRVRFAQ